MIYLPQRETPIHGPISAKFIKPLILSPCLLAVSKSYTTRRITGASINPSPTIVLITINIGFPNAYGFVFVIIETCFSFLEAKSEIITESTIIIPKTIRYGHGDNSNLNDAGDKL